MNVLPKELFAETERIRLDCLLTDLALCFTFVDSLWLELEMGDWDAAQWLLAETEKGYATITRLVRYIADVQGRHEIKRGLNELRTTLDGVRHQLRRGLTLVPSHQSANEVD